VDLENNEMNFRMKSLPPTETATNLEGTGETESKEVEYIKLIIIRTLI